MQRTTAFLKRVRDVYRLTVVSEEALEPAYFAIVALFLGYSPGGKADEEASLRSLEDGAPTEATSVWRGGVAEALLRDYRDALARMRAALQEGAQVLGLSAEGL